MIGNWNTLRTFSLLAISEYINIAYTILKAKKLVSFTCYYLTASTKAPTKKLLAQVLC